MKKPRNISLDTVRKCDVEVCPNCGIIFVKTVKGETWGLWHGRGLYCPACDFFVCAKAEQNEL